MSKTFYIVLLVIAFALGAYNATRLNFDNILEGNSLIACIGILASLCALVLIMIFWTSKRIQEKVKKG
ncbi:hypothetical protein [Croceivirga thetidis]|uniref:DUF3955 domain-containing protein n=1 Tax=Croceivirga thetidis TaxID=2721623 RepID=A0ABX1GM81_9FLAO|nr:hypothetical protein [Croceivirga thetidis]NKI31025.1 hypothetical protein [Croceivirga thetidis]